VVPGLVAVALASPAAAQSPADAIREAVASARLGSGYAQMIELAATPDLSAASYEVTGSEPRPTLDVLRLPYRSRWRALSPESDLYWTATAGYLRYAATLPYFLEGFGAGGVSGRWAAASGEGGLLVRYRLGAGFTLEPELMLGLARLENRASYSGSAAVLAPLLDGLAFNWRTNAWLATPGIALAWERADAGRRILVRAHVAHSWIASLRESEPALDFRETANAYSLRIEAAVPTGLSPGGRNLDGVLYASQAGTFGANRDALGFDAVSEVGAGLQWRPPGGVPAGPVRLSASVLFGPDVRGWTVSLSLPY
jgi:hypothetical protein